MAQGAPPGMTSIVIRIPETLHRQIKRKAAKEDRSMAEYIRHVLKEDLKR